MRDFAFRSGGERVYPMPHPGPDPRFTECLTNSVAGVLVGHGYRSYAAFEDWTALESALTAFFYQPKEDK